MEIVLCKVIRIEAKTRHTERERERGVDNYCTVVEYCPVSPTR